MANNINRTGSSQINPLVASALLGAVVGTAIYRLYTQTTSPSSASTVAAIKDTSSNNVAVHVDTAHPLYSATIEQLHEYMKSGRYTSVGLVNYYLSQIALIDGQLKSVLCTDTHANLLKAARKCDAERAAGTNKGLLHGIPILVKDNVNTVGIATTAGSLALKDNIPQTDATLMKYMKQHGAIVLGKTNMSEWANFRSSHSVSGWSAIGGQCKSPYAYDRCTSGSSSGSGASVAAGLCVAALGSETDGSIVSPANNCGLVGLKPTVGLVSRTGVIPVSSLQDTVGPMCRTVKDCAYVLSAIAGVDPDDAATLPAKQHIHTDYTKFCDANGLKGARIGVIRNLPNFRADTFLTKFDAAVEVIKKSGAVVIDDIEFPYIKNNDFEWGDAEFEAMLYNFKHDVNAYLATTDPAQVKTRTLADVIQFNIDHADVEMPTFQQENNLKAQEKGPLTEQAYIDAVATCKRMAYTEGVQAVIKKHNLDCMISPTGTTSWLIDHINADTYGGSSATIAAVALTPHITVPNGLVHGLPIGVSFLGDMWTEDKLIRIAYAYEQMTQLRQNPKYLKHTTYPIEL